MNPKYFILAVWCIVACVSMSGCSASEDMTSGPELTSFSNSECKNFASYSPKITDSEMDAQTWSEEEPPILSLSYSVERGKLDLHIENLVLGCGCHSVKVIAKVEKNVISIGYSFAYEEDYDCYCPYDIDCRLEQLSPGTYTLDVYGLKPWDFKGHQTTPAFPDDPKQPEFSEEVDLTKDISVSFPYEVRRD